MWCDHGARCIRRAQLIAVAPTRISVLTASDAVKSNALVVERLCAQILPIKEMEQKLGSFHDLNKMHLDRAAMQYRDWGNHTEAVAMQWAEAQSPEGYTLQRVYIRVTGQPGPSPQFVPHFGCEQPLPATVCNTALHKSKAFALSIPSSSH